ncbi:MAG TPA: helix-turn-helix domain-containing protein [Kofleriaceae bacterium]|nr:helix-turn-helix domain-containing protein [Kofleriaceae bacterium]
MHRVVVVAFDGVVSFDLATPAEAFGRVTLANGKPGYRVRVCAEKRAIDAGPFGVTVRHSLDELARADTIIVPGVSDISASVSPRLSHTLRAAAARGTRIASICSGAFVLAAAGLLDGRRATTHWLAAPELARRYSAISVDADVLYVDTGQILTSAGAAAGLDLCLHIVRRDHGAAVAADAARYAVMPLERDGGQSQFIVHSPPPDSSLQPLLTWMEANLHRSLTLDALARRGAMSVRTLNRRFRDQTGTTPLQWLLRARVRRAQHLLETTDSSIEAIAGRAGFGSAASLREHFRRGVRTSPLGYRRAFRAGRTPGRATAGSARRTRPAAPRAPRR